ncbi:ABC transporter ATP-binding protein [Enterocloster bolteae]|jgi:putative spermidine/putrescine transport system ATP-binding protein|uniref:ABC-type quaternary amine transporter n=1 Tax=Enterocloster bolteae 90B8 TaxID=997897 RepID=R0AX87_9FIRM|nr:ABC transporter ATP-binding protein [Enterocloster bolteae]ENZ37384.1 ABC transporter ATP-binding protein [Enterocloster bolteae 90B8]MBS6094991.1 ABC transporter ATP-binding protein [Enterocloster bolteae]RGO84539.1 ABC transporter ATP-binding protein [Enterocloster bolteae]
MSLNIENLRVSLQKKKILHGIDLEIQEGEFVSLLGKSGCGKTTLLKCIAGLLEQESGDIRIQGASVMDQQPKERGTVIVFQDLRLFPHMTAEKNIAFPMELRKVPKKEQKERVEALLRAVQLPGFEKRRMKEMSGGQMQRVALARALAAEPRVLLLDEPFSGLDEGLRTEMARLVRKLHEAWKITTILVTHDKAEALRLSDRIALMEDGKILQYGTPEQMFCHPGTKKVAEYFGKVNYISGSVAGGWFVSPLFEKRTDLPDGVYDAMIRPNSVQLKEEGNYTVEEVTFMGEMTEIRVRVPEKLAPGGSILCQRMEGPGRPAKLRTGMKAGLAVETEGAVLFRHDME